MKALIGFIDVAGLYFALTQLTHRNISQNHKFQAVGLGERSLTPVALASNCVFLPPVDGFVAIMLLTFPAFDRH